VHEVEGKDDEFFTIEFVQQGIDTASMLSTNNDLLVFSHIESAGFWRRSHFRRNWKTKIAASIEAFS